MLNDMSQASKANLLLTSGKFEGRGLEGGGVSARPEAGGLLHLLQGGWQLIKLAVAALKSCLAGHHLGHMLPEVALAGLHRQVSSLQSCPLFCCPPCERAAAPVTGGGLLGAALPIELWGCAGRLWRCFALCGPRRQLLLVLF